jgi:hypothetical protein
MFPVVQGESATLDVFWWNVPTEAADKIGTAHIYWSCHLNATSLWPLGTALDIPPAMLALAPHQEEVIVFAERPIQSKLVSRWFADRIKPPHAPLNPTRS